MSAGAAWAPAALIPDLDTVIRQRTTDAVRVVSDLPEPSAQGLEVRSPDGIWRSVGALDAVDHYRAGRRIRIAVEWQLDLQEASPICGAMHPRGLWRCKLDKHDPRSQHGQGSVRW